MKAIQDLRNEKVVLVGYDKQGKSTYHKLIDRGNIDLKIMSDEQFRTADVIGVYQIGKLLEMHPGYQSVE